MAPRRLQFFSFAFFRVATRRLMPVIWLPSMSTPFRFAPGREIKRSQNEVTDVDECIWVFRWTSAESLPSRLAFNPDGSSKLHPFKEAPSALQQSILTPCRLAPFKKNKKQNKQTKKNKVKSTYFVKINCKKLWKKKKKEHLHPCWLQRGRPAPDWSSTD